MSTKVDQFIADLDGGVFEEKLSAILSDVAASVIDHGKKGTVSITLDIKQIGSSHQVQIDHVLKYKRPTSKGSISEDNSTSTPMHVGTRGALSFFPENQGQMFDKKGEPSDKVSAFPNTKKVN
jgi:hypothetical protein